MNAILQQLGVLVEDEYCGDMTQNAENPGDKHPLAWRMRLVVADCVFKHRLCLIRVFQV
jgi:hypothetical protein